MTYLYLTLILTFSIKLLSVLVTHLFYKDQFAWFSERQAKQRKRAGYGRFLFSYLSIFSPVTLWHANNLPDRTYRALKSFVFSAAVFLVVAIVLLTRG